RRRARLRPHPRTLRAGRRRASGARQPQTPRPGRTPRAAGRALGGVLGGERARLRALRKHRGLRRLRHLADGGAHRGRPRLRGPRRSDARVRGARRRAHRAHDRRRARRGTAAPADADARHAAAARTVDRALAPDARRCARPLERRSARAVGRRRDRRRAARVGQLRRRDRAAARDRRDSRRRRGDGDRRPRVPRGRSRRHQAPAAAARDRARHVRTDVTAAPRARRGAKRAAALVRLRACAPMVLALVLAALTLRLAPRSAFIPDWLPYALGALALVWPALRPADVTRDDTLPALAVMLSAIGLAVVARLSPDLAHKQIVWLAFSLVLAVAAGPAFDRFRVLAAYKYLWILCAIVLFLALALFGQEVNGARLWIRFGPVQFEPVEVIKLLVVLFMASYLAETADVIAHTRPWSLRANAKYLGPLFLGWGVSMAIRVFERDIGMATLLLATFVAMLYVATHRIDLVAGA